MKWQTTFFFYFSECINYLMWRQDSRLIQAFDQNIDFILFWWNFFFSIRRNPTYFFARTKKKIYKHRLTNKWMEYVVTEDKKENTNSKYENTMKKKKKKSHRQWRLRRRLLCFELLNTFHVSKCNTIHTSLLCFGSSFSLYYFFFLFFFSLCNIIIVGANKNTNSIYTDRSILTAQILFQSNFYTSLSHFLQSLSF